MRGSRCCARVSICSFRDGRAPTTDDVLDGAAMRGSGGLVMAGRCGAAIRGAACGTMAGRCGGGAARNAGAAGRAIAGGAAGRAIAGGAAGRAIAGGGPAGRAAGAAGPPGPLRSWEDEPVLTVSAETPRKNAATRTPDGSMISTPSCFVARKCQRASAEIVRLASMTCIATLRCGTGAIRRSPSSRYKARSKIPENEPGRRAPVRR